MTTIPENGQPVLENRPEARGYKVEQLLELARRGKLRIPPFQRPLRWRCKNVLEFFDSIRRGFPVGELLFSKQHAEASCLQFGPVSITAPEEHLAMWVVDGQQRITALVASLLRKHQIPRRDAWAAWYDLENQKFVTLTRREADPSWIPLNALSDSVTQLKWLRNWSYERDREDLVERVLELGKSIREYEIPAYIVEGANEQVLRLIFTRVNNSGVAMQQFEIFEAMYGNEGQQPVRSAVARLADLGFGILKENIFLRCIQATCNLTVKESLKDFSQLPLDAIRRTESALRRAIATITTVASIPVFRLMPYRLPLYVLAAFYDRFPDDSAKVDRLVAKWIWRGALSGRHEDSNNSTVSALVTQLETASSAETAISQMIADLGDFSNPQVHSNHPLTKLDEEVSLRSASGKLFVIALFAAQPVKNDTQFEFEFEDSSDDTEVEESIDSIAGIDNLATVHSSIYMSAIADGKLGTDIVIKTKGLSKISMLNKNQFDLPGFLLDNACLSAIQKGDVAAFRTARRPILNNYLNNFIVDQIGDQTDIRPSISTISSGQQ